MKKILSLFVVLAGFAIFAASLAAVEYYDAKGIPVYGDDLYQTVDGWLYFGRNCYYFDQYGNKVGANGRRVFYYDIYGNFLAGRQVSQPQPVYQNQGDYYDTYGNLISNRPNYYYYYDIHGNLIATSPYDYRYGGYTGYQYEYYRFYTGD